MRGAVDARDDAPVRAVLPLTFAVAIALDTPAPPGSAPAPSVMPPEGYAAPGVGSAYDDDRALAAHADAVADYTLRATLDPGAHSVHGEGTIGWRNASGAPVSELWLHLYLNAFKNERSAFLRERTDGRGSAQLATFGAIDVRRLVLRQGDAPPMDLWPAAELRRPGDDDETDARVPLPRPVAPGERVQLDVTWDDALPSVVERTGFVGSFHVMGQWFPKVARLEPGGRWAHFPFHHLAEFYADYGTYDVTLDVPEGFTIGATGPVVERRTERGRTIERHVQGDVHDFAWTAWDRFVTTRASVDGVDVTLLSPPGFDAVAARDLATIRFALPYFGVRYGRYPYRVLTVVHPQMDAAEAGGMEYPTLITSVGPWWTPPGVAVPEEVTIHELGHQWFYGLVATDEARWPFLDEGLNQAAEVDALGTWRGAGSMVDFLGLRVSDAALQASSSNGRAHDEPVAQPAAAFSTGGNYGALVYARTAALVETLRRVYGDEPVGRALGRYARRYRFEHPGPEELLAVFAEVLGSRVASTMRTALFGKGWVDYEVEQVRAAPAPRAAGLFGDGDKRTKIEPGGRDEGGFEDSVLVRRRGTLAFPVDVAMTMADGTTRAERWDGEGESRRFAWHDAVALRSVVVDPDARVLLDATVTNNHASTEEGGGGSLRTLERAAYALSLALQAVSP